MANLYKNETVTSSRINVFLGWENFNPKGNVAPGRMDQNLCGRLWRGHDRDAIQLSVAACDSPVTNATQSSLKAMKFKTASIGQSFGPTFSTHLFRLNIEVPGSFTGKTVHLLWDSNSEAMVLSEDGTPLQGLVGGNHWARRADYALFPEREHGIAKDGDILTLYIEISCNGLFGAGRGGDIEPPDMDRTYTLEECCLAIFDHDAWDLIHDVTLLQGIAKHHGENSTRRVQALQIANDVVNVVDVSNPSTYADGRAVAREGFFKAKNGQAQSLVSAMLHSHIDLAWLWPMAATPAKGARTFSSALRLMDVYPECVFVQSQAQLYEWVRNGYPGLWKKILQRVKDGRFIPVGGTWVEMDCNIPSGEGLVRQFVLGQGFFQREFGIQCREFWLPDTFGYAAQLPQIMRQCGIDYFLTQKLSWNVFNKFPHSSFIWEGLDGTTVLAHMPPAETYNSQAFPEEVLKSARENRDVSVFDDSVLLVGHGDGGGGASPAMLESLKRMRDVDGMPKVEFNTPAKFFASLATKKEKLPRWVGELYFELHRGTYTSQANVKKCNRQCELLLGQVEVCSSLAALFTKTSQSSFNYPSEELLHCWSRVCKNAFHDTLPGSSIGMVYKETQIDYDFVLNFCHGARKKALHALCSIEPPRADTKGDEAGAKRVKVENGNAVAVNGNGKRSHASNCHLVALSTGPLCKATKDDVRVIEVAENLAREVLTDNVRIQKVPIDQFGDMADTAAEKSVLVAARGLRQGYGISPVTSLMTSDDSFTEVSMKTDVTKEGTRYTIANGKVTLVVEPTGRVSSLKLHDVPGGKGRESLRADGFGGNHLVVYDDVPMFWCAWDTEVYSHEKSHPVSNATELRVVQNGPLECSIYIGYPRLPGKGASLIDQIIRVRAGSPRVDFETRVDWHESRKCLRVLFDCDVRSSEASYDSQFGYVSRTTRFNTSWDVAKFESVGHRFCDLSEYGFGVALMSDCKYGYSVRDHVMRLSLLRSPKSPDDEADMGIHHFTYAFMPHFQAFPHVDVIKEAHDLNEKPLLCKWPVAPQQTQALHCGSMFQLKNIEEGANKLEAGLECVGVGCFKLVENREDAYVLRVYEPMGGRGPVRIKVPEGLQIGAAGTGACSMLEHLYEENDVMVSDCGQYLSFSLKPFEIRSMRLSLSQ